MRIFLTGATGYLGSTVCQALVRAGHEITALTRPSGKARRLASLGVKALLADLGDPSTYRDARSILPRSNRSWRISID